MAAFQEAVHSRSRRHRSSSHFARGGADPPRTPRGRSTHYHAPSRFQLAQAQDYLGGRPSGGRRRPSIGLSAIFHHSRRYAGGNGDFREGSTVAITDGEDPVLMLALALTIASI